MKTELWVVGKTTDTYLEQGIRKYCDRLRHYLPFRYELTPEVKNAGKLSPAQLREAEGKRIMEKLKANDYLILLDDKGREYTSEEFSRKLEHLLQLSHRRLIFQVGGAYGFSEAVRQRANEKLSLSRMTFSHQMVRLFFLEQLYRAMTIMRDEPYHNQ